MALMYTFTWAKVKRWQKENNPTEGRVEGRGARLRPHSCKHTIDACSKDSRIMRHCKDLLYADEKLCRRCQVSTTLLNIGFFYL